MVATGGDGTRGKKIGFKAMCQQNWLHCIWGLTQDEMQDLLLKRQEKHAFKSTTVHSLNLSPPLSQSVFVFGFHLMSFQEKKFKLV